MAATAENNSRPSYCIFSQEMIDQAKQMTYTELEMMRILQASEVGPKLRLLKQLYVRISDGAVFPKILMSLMSCITCEDKHVAKMALLIWEIIPITDAQTHELLPEAILICNALKTNLEHPNEYLCGATLRCTSKLVYPDIILPIVPAIMQAVRRQHVYIRKNALLCIRNIAQHPDIIESIRHLYDEIIEMASGETSQTCRRNAYIAAYALEPELTVQHIISNISNSLHIQPDGILATLVTILTEAAQTFPQYHNRILAMLQLLLYKLYPVLVTLPRDDSSISATIASALGASVSAFDNQNAMNSAAIAAATAAAAAAIAPSEHSTNHHDTFESDCTQATKPTTTAAPVAPASSLRLPDTLIANNTACAAPTNTALSASTIFAIAQAQLRLSTQLGDITVAVQTLVILLLQDTPFQSKIAIVRCLLSVANSRIIYKRALTPLVFDLLACLSHGDNVLSQLILDLVLLLISRQNVFDVLRALKNEMMVLVLHQHTSPENMNIDATTALTQAIERDEQNPAAQDPLSSSTTPPATALLTAVAALQRNIQFDGGEITLRGNSETVVDRQLTIIFNALNTIGIRYPNVIPTIAPLLTHFLPAENPLTALYAIGLLRNICITHKSTRVTLLLAVCEQLPRILHPQILRSVIWLIGEFTGVDFQLPEAPTTAAPSATASSSEPRSNNVMLAMRVIAFLVQFVGLESFDVQQRIVESQNLLQRVQAQTSPEQSPTSNPQQQSTAQTVLSQPSPPSYIRQLIASGDTLLISALSIALTKLTLRMFLHFLHFPNQLALQALAQQQLQPKSHALPIALPPLAQRLHGSVVLLLSRFVRCVPRVLPRDLPRSWQSQTLSNISPRTVTNGADVSLFSPSPSVGSLGSPQISVDALHAYEFAHFPSSIYVGLGHDIIERLHICLQSILRPFEFAFIGAKSNAISNTTNTIPPSGPTVEQLQQGIAASCPFLTNSAMALQLAQQNEIQRHDNQRTLQQIDGIAAHGSEPTTQNSLVAAVSTTVEDDPQGTAASTHSSYIAPANDFIASTVPIVSKKALHKPSRMVHVPIRFSLFRRRNLATSSSDIASAAAISASLQNGEDEEIARNVSTLLPSPQQLTELVVSGTLSHNQRHDSTPTSNAPSMQSVPHCLQLPQNGSQLSSTATNSISESSESTPVVEYNSQNQNVDSSTTGVRTTTRLIQVSGLSDIVYCEAEITTTMYEVIIRYHLVNQSSIALQNVTIELVTSPDLTIVRLPETCSLSPAPSTITPAPNQSSSSSSSSATPAAGSTSVSNLASHQRIMTARLLVNTTSNGIIDGTIVCDSASGSDKMLINLASIQIPVPTFLSPAACPESDFRSLWLEFLWQNKWMSTISTTSTPLQLIHRVAKLTHMQYISQVENFETQIQESLQEDRLRQQYVVQSLRGQDKQTPTVISTVMPKCTVTAANLYAITSFGDQVLLNISVEQSASGQLNTYYRIRAKTETVARSLGDFLKQQQL